MESGVRDSKWSLTKEALERFLTYLNPDRDLAAEKFEEIRKILIGFFEINGCHGAEDLTDQTLDIVIRKLEEVRDLIPYVRGVARRVASDARRRSRSVSFEDFGEPSAPAPSDEAAELEYDRRLRCILQCAQQLPPEERLVVMEYYRYDKSGKIKHKQAMADQLGVTAVALRVRAFRARSKLRKLVEECLRGVTIGGSEHKQ